MTRRTSPNATDLSQLFQRATQQGTLSPQSQSVIQGDLGALVIAGAAGLHANSITAAEVTLVTLVLDASTSIGQRGLIDAVCQGQRALLDAFVGTKEKDSVLVALWTFQSTADVVHAYVPVDDAVRLDAARYQVGGCTHLFDTFHDAMAANVAYAQSLRDQGTPTRSIVVVVTDGEDVGSRRPARVVKQLATDLLASEQFVLALVGVGNDVDFRAVALSMGIPDGCVLVQKDATAHGVRQAFQMVSRSAVRVSQGLVQPGPQAGFFSP